MINGSEPVKRYTEVKADFTASLDCKNNTYFIDLFTKNSVLALFTINFTNGL